MVSEMGIGDRVFFLGALPYDQMPDVYRMCDIFVLPSLLKENIQEQFGLVLAEAMSCGKPVVGSTAGAIPEVVGDAGMIFPAGDYEALSEVLLRLAADDGLRVRLGSQGRRRALEYFSAHENARALLFALQGIPR
jgi:glycosyltransferase involved in cell wall biosynthesis